MKNVDEFKDGLFNLRTRTLWDILNLYMTKHYTDTKFITVRVSIARGNTPKRYNTLYDKITGTTVKDSILSSNTDLDYLCNFQQLKVNELRNLIYCVMFKNKIEVFEATADNIITIPNICYKQHRDNCNESQFVIRRGNIDWHRTHTKKFDLYYEDLCDFAYDLHL